jgi:putative transposase
VRIGTSRAPAIPILAARLILEEALEGEVKDALGRGYYERGAPPSAGYRNGYRTGRVKSAEGAIDYSAVLAAWGILADGKRVLLHLAPGTKEDTASCKEFLEDLRRHGLPDPLLVTSDGAPGLIRAIEECLPRTVRQRCLVYKIRNLE